MFLKTKGASQEKTYKLFFYSLFFFVFFLGGSSLYTLYFSCSFNLPLFIMVIVAFTLSFFWLVFFYRFYFKHRDLSKKLFLCSLKNIVLPMNMIETVFISTTPLKLEKEREEFTVIGKQIQKFLEEMEKHKEFFIFSKKYLQKKSFSFDEVKEITEIMEKTYKGFFELGSIFNKTMNKVKENLEKNKETIKHDKKVRAKILFYLTTALPILVDLAKESNFSFRDVILKVVAQFEEIADFSHQIGNNIKTSMDSLTNQDNLESLAFIAKTAKLISQSFKQFLENLESLKKNSNQFVESSFLQLKNISEFASSIEKISNTIKVISLNVNIEASKNTGNNKGFQVLAKDLREFAEKTMVFVQDVKVTVKDALTSTHGLKNNYHNNIDKVDSAMQEIQEFIFSFEEVIDGAFKKITEVIQTLDSFSNRIDDGVKNIVGSLQHYDVRSQEIEHVSAFIQYIFNQFSFYYQYDLFKEESIKELTKILDLNSQKEMQEEILLYLDSIITTGSERAILEKYEEEFQVKIKKPDIIINNAPPSLEDDDVILF